jgi:hypothetical protein
MTHKPIVRPLVVVGLALFLLVGVVLLPLHTARAASSTHVGIKQPRAAVFTTALPTLTPTLTSAPAPTATEATTPTETPSPTVTPLPTDTSVPTSTPAPTEEPQPTDTPTATATPSALPSDTPTQAPTPAPTPTPSPTPTTTPLEWLPLPPEFKTVLVSRWPLAAGGCLALVLAVLVVLLLLVALRQKKPQPPRSRPEAAPAAYLESGDAAGGSRRFSLKPGGVSIGRAPDNEVVITPDLAGWDTVSRHHARVYQREGQWVIDDLDSANGVWVNGRRTGHNRLQDGWQLRIGGVEFVFHIGAGEAA